jgi:hypothetical protein
MVKEVNVSEVWVSVPTCVSKLPAFYKRSVFTKMALNPIWNTKLHKYEAAQFTQH